MVAVARVAAWVAATASLVHGNGKFRRAEQALRAQTMRAIRVVVVLLLLSGVRAAADPAEELTPERRQELEKKAAVLTEEGERTYRAADYAKAIEVIREALDIRRILYAKTRYPDGHPDLARSLNNLGLLYQVS